VRGLRGYLAMISAAAAAAAGAPAARAVAAGPSSSYNITGKQAARDATRAVRAKLEPPAASSWTASSVCELASGERLRAYATAHVWRCRVTARDSRQPQSCEAEAYVAGSAGRAGFHFRAIAENRYCSADSLR
jgi:hypothetical protein